jgi:hypothetical protein
VKVLVDKLTKVVLDIREQANIVENGIDVGGLIYAQVNQITIYDVDTIPSGVQPQQYLYDPTNGFTPNPNYVKPADINSVIDYVTQQQQASITADQAYKALDVNTTPLADLQKAKIAQLHEKLYKAISTFQSSALGSPHTYLGDQISMTFLAAEYTYVRGSDYKGETTNYYTVEQGRVPHTGEQMAQVFLDGRTNVNNQFAHYDDLKAKVEAAKTNSDVDAINW